MATVTITIQDLLSGGNEVNVRVDFDPPIREGVEGTAAQETAADMLRLWSEYTTQMLGNPLTN